MNRIIEGRHQLNVANRVLRMVLERNKRLQEKLRRRLNDSRYQYSVWTRCSEEKVLLLAFWGANQMGLVLRSENGHDRLGISVNVNTKTGRYRRWWNGRSSLPKSVNEAILSLNEERAVLTLLKKR